MKWVSEGSGLSWGCCIRQSALEVQPREISTPMHSISKPTSLSINKPISVSSCLPSFRYILRSLFTVYFKAHMTVKAGGFQISRVG